MSSEGVLDQLGGAIDGWDDLGAGICRFFVFFRRNVLLSNIKELLPFNTGKVGEKTGLRRNSGKPIVANNVELRRDGARRQIEH